ncbi:MAG TPA: STAS/SEC14 domain-containing protein [Candidatus Kapabacteria bacterium]|nr:STAS/SEC14 domain-containing protein [Candidatus Kapabacteria bacterium]
MIFQEYLFEALGTTIEDIGRGKVRIVYGRPSETLAQVVEQAKWIGVIIETLHKKYGEQELTVLADLGKLDRISLDDRARATYREIMQRPYIEKIAIVGDAFSYTHVLTIMVALVRQSRVKFFFTMKDAKEWLKWT